LIILERKIPNRIKEINALLPRLSPLHPKRPRIEEELKFRWKGHRGELQVDYHLEFLEKENYYILNGLRLLHKDHAFQIDSLIFTQSFPIIVEIKDISGEITFEKKSEQVIRKLNDKEDGFQNPLIQVRKQSQLFDAWLKDHKLPAMNLVELVVYSDRKTIIKTDNRDLYNKVLFADQLVDKIKKLEAQYQNLSPISKKDMQKLKKTLIKEHTPPPPSILQFYGIDKSELILGIQCPNCKQFPLQRKKRKWYCPKCLNYFKLLHKQTILDFFFIIGTTITNKQCREFLLFDSPDIAKKFLQSMKLPTSGANKNRVYHRPLDF
jgi:hypothetical protein